MQPAPRTAVHSSIGHARAMSTPPPTDAMATSGVSALASLCAEFIQSAAGPSGEEEAVDKQRATAALTQIMLSVHGKRATLKEVVVACGSALTSSSTQQRRRGVLLLSELLARLPTLPLDEQAIQTLVGFFTARLSDEKCWKETLIGLAALVQQRALTSAQQVQILRALFDNVAVQSMAQSGRKLALDLLLKVIQSQPAAVVDLGEYAVSGLVRCIDGEKDPRNLLITFKLAIFILAGGGGGGVGGTSGSFVAKSTFPAPLVQAYLEELFEMTSCYYPITFTPPKNDPVGITSADLQVALRQVFAAHGGLSEYVLPMLLEKLDSSAIDCKVDVLDTLRYLLTSGAYSIPRWDPFLDALSRGVRKEMFGSGSTENDLVIAKASLTFAELVRMLCPDQVGGFPAFNMSPSWSLFMAPVLDEIRSELKMPDAKSARSFATLLQLICATTTNAFARSMAVLFPSSIEAKFYSVHVQPSQRVALLELLNLLFAAANQQYAFALPQHPLQPYAESCVAMMSSVLLDGSAEQRRIALKGMADLAALPAFTVIPVTNPPPSKAAKKDEAGPTPMEVDSGASSAAPKAAAAASAASAPAVSSAPVSKRLLPIEQVRSLVQTLSDRLLTDPDETVREQCLLGLVQLSQDQLYSALLLKFTLPALFNARTKALLPLPASTDGGAAGAEDEMDISDLARQTAPPRVATLEDILSAASALCRASSLLAATLPHLLQMVQTHFIGALQGQSTSVQAIHCVLACLSEIVTANGSTSEGRSRLECCVGSLPQALLGLLVNGSLLITKVNPSYALDAKVVATSVTILQTIARTAEAADQQPMIDHILQLFLDGNVAAFKLPSLPAPSDISFTPLIIPYDASSAPPTAKAQLQLLPLFTAVLGSYRPAGSGGDGGVQISRMNEVIRRLGWFIDTHGEVAPDAQQSAIECLAAILNKLPTDDVIFNEFLDQHLAVRLVTQLKDEKVAMPTRLRAATVLLWSTKALVMRGHPKGSELALALIQSLALYPTSPALAEHVARGMSVILMDCTTVLNREAHANCGVGQLYKQRFFLQNLPRLLALFDQTTTTSSSSNGSDPSPAASSRFVILLALAHLLKHVPHAVILSSLSTLVPLLLQSLTHPQAELRVATLETVTVLLSADVHCLSAHLDTLLPVLIDLMRYRPSTRVRLNALVCLEHLRTLPYAALHPYRAQILLALGAAVDDHKRVVRQAAAKARNKWTIMDQ